MLHNDWWSDEPYIREKEKRKKRKKIGENFCLKIDYFRIDENDFETDLLWIIETYLKLRLFFWGGGAQPPPDSARGSLDLVQYMLVALIFMVFQVEYWKQ